MNYRNNNNIFKYEDLNASTKHEKINYGDMMINFMVEDSENKIESQEWKGLDNTTDDKLKDFLYRSDFESERGEASRILVSQGKVLACMLYIDGKYVNEFFEIIDFTELKKTIQSVRAFSLRKRMDEKGRQIFFDWSIVDGKVVKKEIAINVNPKNKSTSEELIKTFTYPDNVKTIPAMIIRNNPNSTADWYQVMDMIFELNLLASDIGTEWEKSKTIFRKLGQFSKGDEFQGMIERVKSGGDIIGDSRMGSQIEIAATNLGALPNLISTMAFIEDRILKYAFQGRDAEASGTNKHNVQVGLFNQAHSEYIFKKIKQRQRDYLRYINDVVSPLIGSSKVSAIEISHSIYEEGKAAGMQQALKQAEMLESQAELNRASAEATKKQPEKNSVNKTQ